VEVRKNTGKGLSEVSDPNDPTPSENPSGQLNQQSVFLTGQEPHELEAQYSMIHHEKKIDIRQVDQIVARFIKEMERNLCPIYLLGTVKSFHEYTYTHLTNVGILTMSLAAEIGFAGNHLHEIGIAALLHDVGKTFIPDEILSKSGMLSSEERTIIEAHPVKGCLYLMALSEIPKVVVISALEHHLKFDGTGYPAIRPGWKPNIVAQMISIADVFDALRSRRSYKEPKPLDVVEGILRKEKGTTFNPELVDIFLKMITPKELQPIEGQQAGRIFNYMNYYKNNQTDFKSKSLLSPENSILQTDNPIPYAENNEKEEHILEKNIVAEQGAGTQTDENNNASALADLFRLIVTHAKAKDFAKAESLREKLIDLDPMALKEIITSAEIIEQEKKEEMSQDHLSLWPVLSGQVDQERDRTVIAGSEHGAETCPRCQRGQQDHRPSRYSGCCQLSAI
jgi:HD-GYP domain-containing protein (c-di-GMP phosphodiesterase class II)